MHVNTLKNEPAANYAADNDNEDAVIARAPDIVRRRYARGAQLVSPIKTREYLVLQHAALEHEVFSIVLLDNQHRVIEFVRLFTGSVDTCGVHPREVVKLALAKNAAAAILSHNHPSGVADPSEADRKITSKLKEALALVNVRVIDHIITGGDTSFSFAEKGWI